MKIVVNDQTIELWDKEVSTARKMAAKCLDTVHKQAAEKKWPTLYFTFLLQIHLMSAELLKSISPETMKQILNVNYQHKVKTDNKHIDQESNENNL